MSASIRRWLRPVEDPPTLPRAEGDAFIAAANKEVVRVQERKRKRGQYHRYDPELRVKIAKYVYVKSLKLMDVNLPLGTKTLNIMVVKLIGFTVLYDSYTHGISL